jgi:Na+/H+ antiporter
LHEIELLLLALMVAVAGLSILARLVRVPYPILLVLGGLVIGFVPAMPAVELPPELVLVAFLPPLLYWSGFFSSPRDLRADARAITLAAVGLVLATTGAVAVVAHARVDGLTWPAAFALVAYRVAVAAAVSGSFVIWQAGLRFLVGATGGVLVGLLVGWLIAEVRRRLDDPVVEIVISVVTGYVAYLPAELLDVSGVLAAVTAGLYVGWRAPELASPSTRLLGFSFWEVMVYLANAVLFILVGLQLRPILSGLDGTAVAVLVGQAALISAVVIAVRLGWVFTVPYLVRLLDRRQAQRLRRAGARERLVTGWSGMRGAVSLAAALALPEDFPMRNLILFLTFAVILATLVLQGLTLPSLIRWLRVTADGAEEQEELRARMAATKAALERLDELAGEDWTRDDTVARLHALFEFRRRRLKARAGIWEDDGAEDRSLAYQRLVRELLQAQRQAVVRLRNQGTISNDVMHRIERELDLEDTRLEI